ncbi:MAG: pseudouridine synthase [Tissierellia bacterium]|nr:pseudouridine synthase [Tissierellia bacterium]
MRLQKFMSRCGVASRRKSEEYIKKGFIKVNDVIVLDPAYDVKDIDIVKFKDKTIKLSDNKVYYLLNKPVGVLSSAKDDRGRVCVVDYIDTDERIFPVGRLDLDSSGLILLTNDGEITFYLTHPSFEIEKTYIVAINKDIDKKTVDLLEQGVEIEGKITAPAKLKVINKKKNNTILEIRIKEGRNRQIRKMFEAVGITVISLERIAIGKISDKKLKPGKYRKLNEYELKYLENIKNAKV